MFGSEVVEVAIGMSLLFLFMSLIATALQEMGEAWLKKRSQDLERGLGELLHNQGGALEALYNHPLVSSLYTGEYATAKKQGTLPSYIPAGNFSAALLDMVARGLFTPPAPSGPGPQPADRAAVQAAGQNARQAKEAEIRNATDAAGKPLPLPAPAQIQALMRVAELRATAQLMPDGKLKDAVLALMDQASTDLSKLRTNVEAWFDGTMDRVSGWYKRRAQYILFGIGLGAAVGFNVDAITVAEKLSSDKALRSVAVARAERIASPTADQTKLPPELQNETLTQLQKEISDIGYPVGWAADPTSRLFGVSPAPQGCGTKAGAIKCEPLSFARAVATLLGWLITALAITLGAPFWFDLLNKFMVIRSTVKPREKSQEEGSEDRQNTTPVTLRLRR